MGQKGGNFDKSLKIFFSLTTASNALRFGMDYPQDQEMPLSSNEVPGVTNGHTLRIHNFTCTFVCRFM